MRLKNRLTRGAVAALLGGLAWLARREYLNAVTERVTSVLAGIVASAKGIQSGGTLESLGRQWQRSFPSAKQVPIVAVTDNTVFAEIHTPCPLRGSGDVNACYRMMNYDRAILEGIGGQFVVLESQATPGKSFCRVAIRKQGESLADLRPAHWVNSLAVECVS